MLESRIREGNDNCQKTFNEEIRRVHREYDEGVNTCIIVTLATGGAGFAPCNAANVYRVASNSHQAIQLIMDVEKLKWKAFQLKIRLVDLVNFWTKN